MRRYRELPLRRRRSPAATASVAARPMAAAEQAWRRCRRWPGGTGGRARSRRARGRRWSARAGGKPTVWPKMNPSITRLELLAATVQTPDPVAPVDAVKEPVGDHEQDRNCSRPVIACRRGPPSPSAWTSELREHPRDRRRGRTTTAPINTGRLRWRRAPTKEAVIAARISAASSPSRKTMIAASATTVARLTLRRRASRGRAAARIARAASGPAPSRGGRALHQTRCPSRRGRLRRRDAPTPAAARERENVRPRRPSERRRSARAAVARTLVSSSRPSALPNAAGARAVGSRPRSWAWERVGARPGERPRLQRARASAAATARASRAVGVSPGGPGSWDGPRCRRPARLHPAIKADLKIDAAAASCGRGSAGA